MSGEKMILVLFLALAVTSQNCPSQSCKTNPQGFCYTYNSTENAGQSSKCGDEFYCDFGNNVTAPAFCKQKIEYDLLPGQKCSYSEECVEGIECVKNYCEGIAATMTCTSTNQCAPNLYCKILGGAKNGTCSALAAPGGSCAVDTCTYGYVCSNEICVKQYSIAVGNSVDPNYCYPYGIQTGVLLLGHSVLCESGSCLENVTNPTDKTAICIKAITQKEKYESCVTCTGVSGSYSVSVPCLCGLSGKAYCPGFPGDEYNLKAVKLDKEYMTSSDIKKCNIFASISCIKDHGDRDDYYEYMYYNYLASDRYMVHDAATCAQEALTKYYEYKNEIESSSSSSSSSSFGQLFAVSALIYGVIA